MQYDDLVRDFVARTKANLALVRAAVKSGQEAYEVTQFINSLFGLLVLPQQEFFDKIPKTKLVDLEKDGWPIPRVHGNYRQVSDLKALARYMRNGISHCNIRFTEKGGYLDGLIIWNELPNGKRNWEAELKIEELEGITDKFAKLILKEEPPKIELTRTLDGHS